MFATGNGGKDYVIELINLGADVNISVNNNDIALQYAVCKGDDNFQ